MVYLVLISCVQDDVAGCFEYYADLAEALDSEQKTPISLPMETFKSHVLKEPIGVVGLITPWYLNSLFFFFRFVVCTYSICKSRGDDDSCTCLSTGEGSLVFTIQNSFFTWGILCNL